jgi:hypothetical protein
MNNEEDVTNRNEKYYIANEILIFEINELIPNKGNEIMYPTVRKAPRLQFGSDKWKMDSVRKMKLHLNRKEHYNKGHKKFAGLLTSNKAEVEIRRMNSGSVRNTAVSNQWIVKRHGKHMR